MTGRLPRPERPAPADPPLDHLRRARVLAMLVPRIATFAEPVKVAGARWAMEACFQATKSETALDHYQVRKHLARYRQSGAPGGQSHASIDGGILKPYPVPPGWPGSLRQAGRAAR